MTRLLKVVAVAALVAVIGVSMVACGGGDKKDSGSGAAATETGAGAAAKKGGDSNDALIDEFERFVMNEYVPFAQKLKAGDMSVMMQAQDMQTKINDFTKRIEPVEPNFTDAQKARAVEINNKVRTAMGQN